MGEECLNMQLYGKEFAPNIPIPPGMFYVYQRVLIVTTSSGS
jgi:hypothetical protein